MSYVEALEAEVDAATSYLDSNGTVLEVGDRVHVSLDLAEGGYWDEDKEEQLGADRPFDFGTVDSLNDDGTVTVWWDLSGCYCDASEGSPRENPSHITKTNEDVERFAGVILDNAKHVHHVLGI